MSRRDLLTEAEREQLFGLPVDCAALAKFYTLTADDIERVQTRRSDALRLGFAVQITLLRHPGFGWRSDEPAPPVLIDYLAEQLGLPPGTSPAYGRRQTRLEHGWEAAAHVGLRPAAPADVAVAIERATEAARETDRGLPIASAIVNGMHTDRVILVAPARIERIGIAGRARARRLAADTVLSSLTADQVAALDRLLVVDTKTGVTPLAWLRDIGDVITHPLP